LRGTARSGGLASPKGPWLPGGWPWKPASLAPCRSTCGLRPCPNWQPRRPTTDCWRPNWLTANGITRVKGVASKGARLGNWLSAPPSAGAPQRTRCHHQQGSTGPGDSGRPTGLRVAASEIAALTVKHIQQRDGRWCIMDLVGKHGREWPHQYRLMGLNRSKNFDVGDKHYLLYKQELASSPEGTTFGVFLLPLRNTHCAWWSVCSRPLIARKTCGGVLRRLLYPTLRAAWATKLSAMPGCCLVLCCPLAGLLA
jgi:hypothetical protein